jgi:hypothetical protein
MGFRWGLLIACAVAGAAVARAGSGSGAAQTQITVWSAAPPPAGQFGGLPYGGFPPTTGALITLRRSVEIAGGEARLTGVAQTLDPGSVQLRDLGDPAAVVTSQRFIAGATTPTDLLVRHLRDPITVVTARGEVTGTLRAVDEHTLVIEVGTGDQRRLQMLGRDGYVQDIRLPSSAAPDEPSLVWRVHTAVPGNHAIEVSYRADGMSWTADYLAVLDEPGKTLELSARATVANATGASYDDAQLTLVTSDPAIAQPGAIPRGAPPPARFAIAAPTRIGRGESVQVALIPARIAQPVRSVIAFEANQDASAGFHVTPGIDCNQLNAIAGDGRAEIDLEVSLPASTVLPQGKVRLFHRSSGRLDVVSEDALHGAAGIARIRVAPSTEITGERHAVTCNYDERGRSLREAIELKIASTARQPVDVVIREFLWRWPIWHLEAEDHKGVRAGPQLQEYRVRVPPAGSQRVTYTVVYTW